MSYTNKLGKLLFTIALIPLVACAGVNSSELESTAAEDLQFLVTINEYNYDDEADFRVTVKTLDSGTRVEFDQGETITAYTMDSDDVADSEDLSDRNFSDWLGIDGTYSVRVDTAVADEFYGLTYTDVDSNQTSITAEKLNIVPITSHSDGDNISGDELTLTWDPDLVTNGLHFRIRYDDVNGESQTVIEGADESTGTVTIDSSDFNGEITINLIHSTREDVTSDFGLARVTSRSYYRLVLQYQ